MRFAKLIAGSLFPAPNPIYVGSMLIGNPSLDLLTAQGYKPVHCNDAPTVEPGFVAVPGWEESGEELVQVWTVVEEPDDVDADRAMEILFGEEES